MKRFALAVLLIAWTLALAAQEPFTSLEERMTGREFSAAGLDKLTESELKALNDWLRDHSVATLASASPGSRSDQRGRPETNGGEADEVKLIESRLVGAFDGWDGATVFKLENGMVWRQSEEDVFRTRPVENPQITIKRGMFGTWKLRVEGFDSKIKVERIQ